MRNLSKTFTAALAATMLVGALSVATPADAAWGRWGGGGWGRGFGGWGHGGWGRGWGYGGGWGRGWGYGGAAAAGLLGGLALGAAASSPYYGGYYGYGGYPYGYSAAPYYPATYGYGGGCTCW